MKTVASTDSNNQLSPEMVDDIIKGIFHPRTSEYIGQLANTYLYGDGFRNTIIGLVDEGIRNAIKDGLIKND